MQLSRWLQAGVLRKSPNLTEDPTLPPDTVIRAGTSDIAEGDRAQQVEFDIRYGRGIDAIAEAVDLGELRGLVSRCDAGMGFADLVWPDHERMLQSLRADPMLLARLRAAITTPGSL